MDTSSKNQHNQDESDTKGKRILSIGGCFDAAPTTKLHWITVCAALLIGGHIDWPRPTAIGAQKGAENSMELTIYNSNLALVKETRAMEIPEGLSRVLFPNISAKINPATVSSSL